MHELTELIRQDMCPALGVTEPGAIAFVVATARKHTAGAVKHITLRLNSGMFKNAFTCGIPNSTEVGNCHAAALGACGADPDKRLECLDGITAEQAQAARNMAAAGIIKVEMTEITSRIFIEAEVETDTDTSCVTIRDAHTNIVKITENGKTVYEKPHTAAEESHAEPLIHRYTLAQLHDYALTVPAEELTFIRKAFELNYALCQAGIASPKTTYARCLLEANDGQMISDDEQKTASLLCNAAIEARVLGLPEPAMSITGSGAHGIIATMPLYAAYKVRGYSEEMLLRATALSYLVCMYIKEYSGKLSAFCGCAIAAGTGMACGLVLLRGGQYQNYGAYHQQFSFQYYRHDMRRRQPGLYHERHCCRGRRVAGSITGRKAGVYLQCPRNQRRNTGTDHAQHGADCLPRYGGNGKDDCGDFAG